ncbi:hypothetical protein H4R33_003618 [Dimargaris cristalligena]|uniref:YEATS domain-containing protein n=1 Tax=Dimargaris cristalligena TaxID=215637 RepID=A0A4Q0A0U7_9FUNG|nr:hypothetical protein H4R33_003618 [Dimargaris cristalligena]RKP39634.1 hypothetical protein BJ085DRAFT_36650 [Dimargaris cristalligena]|eukprot:RKP39634.1 hypothetical protein BJ085DRAFT_36650 [Dimargaris cristalligena]
MSTPPCSVDRPAGSPPADASPPDLRQKIERIIRYQFDLEIHLKQREIIVIKEEIVRSKRSVQEYQRWKAQGLVPQSEPVTRQPSRITSPQPDDRASLTSGRRTARSRAKRLNYDERDPRAISGTSKGGQSSSVAGDPLVVHLMDGSVVKIVCPTCQREQFSTLQGFLNHTRLRHSVEFASHEEAVRLCGVPLDQPAETVVGTTLQPNWLSSASAFAAPQTQRPSANSATPGLSALMRNGALNDNQRSQINSALEYIQQKPGIKVFDEDVDLDSDSNSPTDGTTSAAMTPTASQSGPAVSHRALNKPSKTHRKVDSRTGAKHDTSQDNPPLGNFGNELDRPLPVPERQPPAPETPTGISLPVPFPKLMGRGRVQHNESRFYIPKRILVGDVSKFLPKKQRPPNGQHCLYRWMLYVTTPDGEPPLSTFIERIQVLLHESYRPNDVVDIVGPKFQISRYGWGESLIKLRLFFVDAKRNKPVNVDHLLTLDKTQCGEQVPGKEQIVDLSLDRQTEFVTPTANNRSGGMVAGGGSGAGSRTTGDAMNLDVSGSLEDIPHRGTATGPPSRTLKRTPPEDILQLEPMVVPWLMVGADWFPLILTPAERSQWETGYRRLPFCTAPSEAEYWRWPLGKRKAVEWRRARCIRDFLRRGAWQGKNWHKKFTKYSRLWAERNPGTANGGMSGNPTLNQPGQSSRRRSSCVASGIRLTAAQAERHMRIEEDQQASLSDISTWTILQWCRLSGLTPALPPPDTVLSIPELLLREREALKAAEDTQLASADLGPGPSPDTIDPLALPETAAATPEASVAGGEVVRNTPEPIIEHECYCRLCGTGMCLSDLLPHLEGRQCGRVADFFTAAAEADPSLNQPLVLSTVTQWYEYYAQFIVNAKGYPMSLSRAPRIHRPAIMASPNPFMWECRDAAGEAQPDSVAADHGNLSSNYSSLDALTFAPSPALAQPLTTLANLRDYRTRTPSRLLEAMVALDSQRVFAYYSIMNLPRLEALNNLLASLAPPPTSVDPHRPMVEGKVNPSNTNDRPLYLDQVLPWLMYTAFIDWVYSATGSLGLSRLRPFLNYGLSGSGIMSPRQGGVDDPILSGQGTLESNHKLADSNSQLLAKRLEIGSILAQVTKAFLGKLIRESLTNCQTQLNPADQTIPQPASSRMFLPLHVYHTCLTNPDDYDFLTNRNMGTSNSTNTP